MEEYSFSQENLDKIEKAQELLRDVKDCSPEQFDTEHSLDMLLEELNWLIEIYSNHKYEEDMFKEEE